MSPRTQTYSFQQVADLLGVSAVTIGRWADAGDVPTITIGKRRLVPKSYVEKLFADSGYPLKPESANAG